MHRSKFTASALVIAGALSGPAHAAADAELADIRDEIRQLKQSYEARIAALEQRLKEAEAKAGAAAAASPETPVAQGGAPAAMPAQSGSVAAAPPREAPATAAAANAFNPAIMAVLQGAYVDLSQDPTRYAIAGFVPSGDIAPARRGFNIAESELGLSANVDDKVYGSLTLALAPDNQVEVEEAYGALTALPYGLAPKFGRFLSSIGYLNDQHRHVWDFYDAPLPYQAFLGGQFRSDGLQLKWVAPTDTFVEFGGEIGNGASFPGTDTSRNGIGDFAVYAHAGGDVGASNSWRAGLSYLQLRPNDRQYALVDRNGTLADLSFSGKSELAIADFVWKWAPNGNARATSFKLQGEYFWRRESGSLTYDRDDAQGLLRTGGYSSRQSGWYLQGVYQFLPGWRFGGRYDRLDPGRVDYGANGALLQGSSLEPWRYALMVDWTPSEFSRFRVQWQQARLQPDVTDNQLFLQYILTLGAHGAHSY